MNKSDALAQFANGLARSSMGAERHNAMHATAVMQVTTHNESENQKANCSEVTVYFFHGRVRKSFNRVPALIELKYISWMLRCSPTQSAVNL